MNNLGKPISPLEERLKKFGVGMGELPKKGIYRKKIKCASLEEITGLLRRFNTSEVRQKILATNDDAITRCVATSDHRRKAMLVLDNHLRAGYALSEEDIGLVTEHIPLEIQLEASADPVVVDTACPPYTDPLVTLQYDTVIFYDSGSITVNAGNALIEIDTVEVYAGTNNQPASTNAWHIGYIGKDGINGQDDTDGIPHFPSQAASGSNAQQNHNDKAAAQNGHRGLDGNAPLDSGSKKNGADVDESPTGSIRIGEITTSSPALQLFAQPGQGGKAGHGGKGGDGQKGGTGGDGSRFGLFKGAGDGGDGGRGANGTNGGSAGLNGPGFSIDYHIGSDRSTYDIHETSTLPNSAGNGGAAGKGGMGGQKGISYKKNDKAQNGKKGEDGSPGVDGSGGSTEVTHAYLHPTN